MTKQIAREALIAGAVIVERETRGHLPVASFAKIIDKGLLPQAPAPLPDAPDNDLIGFIPINVALDGRGEPTEAKSLREPYVTGAVAIYPDRAVIGWVKGIVRAKVGTFTFPLDAVKGAQSISFGDLPGIDITLRDGRVISFVFGTSIDRRLAASWAQDLGQLLSSTTTESAA